MKPFDLTLAKSGHPIVTRAGRPARFIAHVPDTTNPATRLVVIIDEEDNKLLRTYFESGEYNFDGEESKDDLFHPVVKKSGWINLFAPALNKPDVYPSSKVWNTREYAEAAGKMQVNYITTIEIHWEE